MLSSLSLEASASAEDVSGAIENYRAQASAAALDDKCAILKPDERAVLKAFRDGLVGFIGQKNARFVSVEKQAVDAASRSVAQTGECENAAASVRGVYEDTVATNLAIKPALLTVAMSVGESCKAISAADNGILMQAWTSLGNEVVKDYSAAIRIKYLLHAHAAEQAAEKVPCSDARRTVDAALSLARQVPHP